MMLKKSNYLNLLLNKSNKFVRANKTIYNRMVTILEQHGGRKRIVVAEGYVKKGIC